MKTFLSALALVTLSVYGCGDDDDDGNNSGTGATGATSNAAGETNGSSGSGENMSSGGGDTASGGGDATSGGGEATSAGGAPSGNVMCDPEAMTTCQNDMDCEFVESGEARLAAGQCGLDCLQSDEESCAVDCITAAIEISADCAGCYAGAVACAQKNCLAACIEDPESDGCKACQVEKGCRDEFNTCSGLE
jgi:hypothetical protein